MDLVECRAVFDDYTALNQLTAADHHRADWTNCRDCILDRRFHGAVEYGLL